MAIISFWSNGKTETGKAAAMVAIATFLGIQRDFKILVLDTKYNDYFYQDCYWQEDKTIKLIYGQSEKTNIGSGISGLAKAILSNKTSPEIVTNYTRIVFKDRVETEPGWSEAQGCFQKSKLGTHMENSDLSFGCPRILHPRKLCESGIIVLQYIAFDPESRNYSSL